jgi:hypothetical protein
MGPAWLPGQARYRYIPAVSTIIVKRRNGEKDIGMPVSGYLEAGEAQGVKGPNAHHDEVEKKAKTGYLSSTRRSCGCWRERRRRWPMCFW